MVIAVNFDEPDLAELTLADDSVAGFDQVRRAAALGADLHDALMLTGSGQHGLAFGHIDADRLLHIDIGASLDGRDHRQGVPVIGRRDQDDIQVFFLEHFAIIAIGARSFFGRLAVRDHVGGAGQHLLVDVTERHDLDRRDLEQANQVALAIPAAADRPTRLASWPKAQCVPSSTR